MDVSQFEHVLAFFSPSLLFIYLSFLSAFNTLEGFYSACLLFHGLLVGIGVLESFRSFEAL